MAMQSSGKVREISSAGGTFSVAIEGHDQSFTVRDNEMSDFILGMLRAAQEKGETVSFAHGPDRIITEIIV